MRKFTVTFCALTAMITVAFGGPSTYSGKEMKETAQPPPCPEWYRDTEWNVDVWGTYAFTGSNWEDDRYFESDHAWGGGLDIKYFFHRYFGIGLEGWATESTRQQFDGFNDLQQPVFSDDQRVVGAVKGTFTLRYPIPCSRFAPYVYAGGGAIFGGGERDRFTSVTTLPGAITIPFQATHSSSDTRALGQFGGGIEVRLTPHIGWMNDFSWNVVDGPNNNFGMARSGITFAF